MSEPVEVVVGKALLLAVHAGGDLKHIAGRVVAIGVVLHSGRYTCIGYGGLDSRQRAGGLVPGVGAVGGERWGAVDPSGQWSVVGVDGAPDVEGQRAG